jgi:signal transduction histidine kinase
MPRRLAQWLRGLAARRHLARRTVRLRLTLLYGALFLVSGAALLTVTYLLVEHATGNVLTYQGPNGQGATIARSSHAPPGQTTPREQQIQTNGGPGAEGLTPKQLEAQSRQLETLAVRQHNAQMQQLLVNSASALGVMALVSIMLGWVTAGRILRPIRTITSAARDISASNLSERIALAGPEDELKELGDTFDDLLGRLDASFRAQRQFVANASHELRTPLARQRTLAQVALSDPDASIESLRLAHERVLASGEQQERLIEALLTLTRGHATPARSQPFDLEELADQILLARRPESAPSGIEVTATLSPAPMRGDRHLIERLIANLIDNALHYNIANGRVDVSTRTDGTHAVISISNTGPVIPPADVDRLRQPFQRLAPTRSAHGEGLGLGLSIADAIASAHAASMCVKARPEGGLCIEVRFPASSRS